MYLSPQIFKAKDKYYVTPMPKTNQNRSIRVDQVTNINLLQSLWGQLYLGYSYIFFFIQFTYLFIKLLLIV